MTPDFSMKAIDDLVKAIPEIMAEEIIRAFSYLGEQCEKRIRDRSAEESWIDQTGNLRSSIGYAVYEDGQKIIQSAFNQVKDGMTGTQEGKKIVDELASRYSETFALVVVAGMNYAEYVEAKDNKDVLASTDLWARTETDHYLRNAVSRASKRIANLQSSLGL